MNTMYEVLFIPLFCPINKIICMFPVVNMVNMSNFVPNCIKDLYRSDVQRGQPFLENNYYEDYPSTITSINNARIITIISNDNEKGGDDNGDDNY